MERTSAVLVKAGRPPYPDGDRTALSCVDRHENSRITKRSKLSCFLRLIPAALIIAGSLAITSDQGPSRFEIAHVSQTTSVGPVEDMRTGPSLRAVMTNPYEQVGSIMWQGVDDGQEKNSRIHALYMQSTRRSQNASAEIRVLSERTQASWSALDLEAARGLFRPEEEVGAVSNQLADTEVWRDWMVPSISMVEEGETSISPPEFLYLDDWELVRDDLGHPVVGRVGKPLTRVRASAGMTLGDLGSVVAVRDTPDAYYLILENGKRVAGNAGLEVEMRSVYAP